MSGQTIGGLSAAVSTPRETQSFTAKLISGQPIPAFLARIGAGIAAFTGPIRIAGNVIAARHADVTELLARDLEFCLPAMNHQHIEEVNGPFILGMDRKATLSHERTALYRALRATPLHHAEDQIAIEATAAIAATGPQIDVVGGYARKIAAHTARLLFGITDPPDDVLLMDVARAIFNHTFLNISNDKVVRARALAAAPLMKSWLEDAIAVRQRDAIDLPDFMGALLRQIPDIDADTVRRTLGGMLVGSIDTTTSSVAKIIAVIARNPTLNTRIAADANDPVLLRGWCWEALRCWPHNPVLFRLAAVDTILAGTPVEKGDRIIAWTQAAMQDAKVFTQPRHLRPDRPPADFLHFGGGLHPCAGRSLNAIQIPLLVGALVRRGIASAGPIAWAGPFPDQLIIQFRP